MSAGYGSFSELFSAAEQTDEYWTERAMIELTEEISRLMELRGITRAELAETLGCSPAYVTKILRGNVNFTLATMTRLARALGAVVRIHLDPAEGLSRSQQPRSEPAQSGRAIEERKPRRVASSRGPSPPARLG